MTPERILSAVEDARAAIHLFMPPHKPPHEYMNFDRPLTARRADLSQKDVRIDDQTALRQGLFMCDQIEEFVHEERIGKALCWLGFLQGVLWMTGAASIDDSRRANMPPEIGGFEEARI